MKIIIEKKDLSQFVTGVLELARHDKEVKTKATEKKSTEEADALIKAVTFFDKHKDSLTMAEYLPTEDVQKIVLGVFDDAHVDTSGMKTELLKSTLDKLSDDNLDEAGEREIAALVAQFALAGVGKVATGGNHFIMAMLLDKTDDEELEEKYKSPVDFVVDGDVWCVTF